MKVERTDPYAAYNMQILEIYQRTNYYDATPITVWDQNAIEIYGLRIASTVTAHEICVSGVAQTAAQLIFNAASISATTISSSFLGNIACSSRWISSRSPTPISG